VPGDAERVADNRALVTGETDPATWRRLVRKYGVDVVVAKARAAGGPAFVPYPKTPAMGRRTRYVVVRISECSG
jgi:hypothetical protein